MGLEGLDFQVVPVEFTGGIDTRTNQKLRLPGKWDLLLNCTQSKDGTPAKRDGVRALVPTLNGHGLATFDDELLAIDGTQVTATTINPSVGAVAVPGQLPCLYVEKKNVAQSGNTHDSVDCAYDVGLEVYVWREYSIASAANLGVYFCAVDSATRSMVVQRTLLSATGFAPKVVALSGSFMFFWMQGAGPLLPYAEVYTPGVGVGAPVALGIVIMAAATAGFDAVAFGFDGVTNFVETAALSYVYADGVTSVRCAQVTFNEITLVPAVMATTNLVTEVQAPFATICGIGLSISGGTGGAAAYATTTIASPAGGAALSGVAGAAIDDAWAASTATLIDGVAIFTTVHPTHVTGIRHLIHSLSECQIYVDGFADRAVPNASSIAIRGYSVFMVGPGFPLTVVRSWDVARSNLGLGTYMGPFIAGAPMIIGAASSGSFSAAETVALPVRLDSRYDTGILQSGIFLLDGSTGAVLGKALYGRLVSYDYGAATVPSTPQRTSTPTTARTGLATFMLPVLEQGHFTLLAGSNRTESGVSVVLVTPNVPMGTNAADTWAPRRTQLGRAAMIANGMLAMYDGSAVCEADFNLFPEGLTATRAAGGGTWAAGTYEFVAIYEWIDSQGQRHQSAPSPTVQLVVTLNDTVTFRVPTLQLTQRANVKHVLYGTQPNGTTFTRLGSAWAPVEIQNNKALSHSVTAVLAGPPASNELLYSQPFVADTTLPNDAPGPCSVAAVHQNRLWVNLTDSDGAFRYSQQLISGVGVQFNEVLGGQVPVAAGSIMGFASMDETLVILTERKLFRITGTGPTPSGGYNGYSDPVEIPSDVGCNSAASVLSIPDGVMFRSSKGWHVLSRDLSVRYVGGPIKKWDADIITSVVLMEDRQEIRVSSRSTTDTAFSGALQFCYSYVSDTWSVFQIISQTRSALFINCLQVWDAVWWPTTGRYVSIGYYDGINQDTPGTYLDWVGTNVTGYAIGMSARSSFLHLSALNGFQRVRWLYLTASAPSAPATSLSFRIDYDDLYSVLQPPGAPGAYLTTGTVLTAIPFANPAAVDIRHKFRRQKCKSVAITINENPVSPGAPGLTGFQAMALQIGIRRGVNRLPPTHVVG